MQLFVETTALFNVKPFYKFTQLVHIQLMIVDQKKFTFVQEIPLNASVRGITNERPFIYG